MGLKVKYPNFDIDYQTGLKKITFTNNAEINSYTNKTQSKSFTRLFVLCKKHETICKILSVLR